MEDQANSASNDKNQNGIEFRLKNQEKANEEEENASHVQGTDIRKPRRELAKPFLHLKRSLMEKRITTHHDGGVNDESTTTGRMP